MKAVAFIPGFEAFAAIERRRFYFVEPAPIFKERMVINMTKEAAILMVSFGTTHLDTLERSIAETERAVGRAFVGHKVYRAFTSGMVRRRLFDKHSLQVDSVSEALARIKADGFDRVAVQPTLVMGGTEYELLCRDVQNAGMDAAIGRALIENEDDAAMLARIIMDENPPATGEALILMGHGTEHSANWIYSKLQQLFCTEKYPAFVGTVEGTPTFDDAVRALVKSGAKRARLMPLMFVAGDHAKNDMAGSGENSLLSLVRAAGVDGVPVLRGLGESEAVRNIYIVHAKEALMGAEA